MKTAVLFAGQGAQYSGMGKNLYETNPAAQKILDKAGQHIKDLCFNGDSQQLSLTINTQPCVFTLSAAHYEGLKEAGVAVDAVAGFSVGEYAALYAAQMFSFEDGLALVSKRAKYMSDISGGMAAVLCSEDRLGQLLKCAKVEAVNYNCPGQIVVAGQCDEVEKFVGYCKEEGVKAIRLSVSGPFHSTLMQPAAAGLEKDLENFAIEPPKLPIVLNTTGEFLNHFNQTEFKNNMVAQIKSAVLWEKSIRQLISHGIDTMIEAGPGKVLSGFVKKIDRSIKLISAEEFLSEL